MDHGTLLVERDDAIGIDAEDEDDLAPVRRAADDRAALDREDDGLTRQRVDEAGRTGRDSERIGRNAARAVGVVVGREERGEIGCCIDGEVAFVDFERPGFGFAGVERGHVVRDAHADRSRGLVAVEIGRNHKHRAERGKVVAKRGVERVIVIQSDSDSRIIAADRKIERDDYIAIEAPDDLRVRDALPREPAAKVVERRRAVVEDDRDDGIRALREGDRAAVGDRRGRIRTIGEVLVVDRERNRVAGDEVCPVNDGDWLRGGVEIVVAVGQCVCEGGIDRASRMVEIGIGIEGPVALRIEGIGALGSGDRGRPVSGDCIVGAVDIDRGHAGAVGTLDIIGEQIARQARRIVFGNGQRGFIDRIGDVVDDADGDRAGADQIARGIVDLVGEAVRAIDDIAGVLRSIAIGKGRGERVDIFARVFVEYQCAIGPVGRTGQYEAERTGGVGHGDLAGRDFAVGIGIAAARKAGFIDHRIVVADRARRIGDIDGQGGSRGVSVAVDDRIGEDIDHRTVGRVGIRGIGIGARRDVHCQRAVLAGDDKVAVDNGGVLRALVGAGHADNAGKAVGPGDVVGRIGQDITADRKPFADAGGIVVGRRRIVVEHDAKRGRHAVAVAVGDDKTDRCGRIGGFFIGAACVKDIVQQGDDIGAVRRIGQLDREQHAARAGSGQDIARNREGHLFGADHGGRAVEIGVEGDDGGAVIADAECQRAGEARLAGVGRIVAVIGVEIIDVRVRIAADKAVVIHRGGNRAAGRQRIGQQRDGNRGARNVAVAVGDGVVESDHAFFARAGDVGEGAIAIVDQRTGAAERALDEFDGRDRDVVRARRVVEEDIHRDRRIFLLLRTGIVACDRGIVDDPDAERSTGDIAIDIGNADREVVDLRAERIVQQDIAIACLAIADRGDRERAVFALEGLADLGDENAVDAERAEAIGRREDDHAIGDLAVACGRGPFGLAIARG